MDNENELECGIKEGVVQSNKGIQLYKSFTIGGVKYSLYDCVYLYHTDLELSIGKIVKLYQTPKKEKRAKVVWFFRPTDIRPFLGDIEPRWNELFLACGQGKGLSNDNDVDAIVGKCNVICTSKDKRNPQASEEELKRAEYTFCRTFNVGNYEISEKFSDEIIGTKVEFFFNRRKDQNFTEPPSVIKSKQQREHSNVSSRLGLNKRVGSPARNGKPASRNSSLVKAFSGSAELEKGTGKVIIERGCCSSDTFKKRFPVEVEIEAGRLVKDKSKVRPSEATLPENTSDTRPYKKRLILLNGKGSIGLKAGPTKGDDLGVKASETSEKTGARLASHRSVKTINRPLEVDRGHDVDRRNWFKQLPWEERLQKAQDAGTLVLLENLDPSYAALEVEDLVWQAFYEKVQAKIIQRSAFSSPLNGKAFVIFKTKVAAESAISELNRKCLILDDGRPVIGRRRHLRVPEKATSFVGHLVIDRIKPQKQREEMRNAVSTSHCSQPNTIEFDFAMQWREGYEKSDLCWEALYKQQMKEITDLKSRLKLNQS